MIKKKIAAHIQISDIFVVMLINSQINGCGVSCIQEFHSPNFSFFQTSVGKER